MEGSPSSPGTWGRSSFLVRKPAPRKCPSSRRSSRWRKTGFPWQARSKKAVRSSAFNLSAASKRDSSDCFALFSIASQCDISRPDPSPVLPFYFCIQPGTRVGPVTLHRWDRDTQRRRNLRCTQPNEIAELNDLGFLGRLKSELFQSIVHRKDRFAAVLRRKREMLQIDPLLFPAVPDSALS